MTDRLSPVQIADRLAEEMTKAHDIGEVYGMNVMDPSTGKEYRIEAAETSTETVYQVQDLATGEPLYFGARERGDPPALALEDGRDWLENNVFDATRIAQLAPEEPLVERRKRDRGQGR